jgi:hypothetical protein
MKIPQVTSREQILRSDLKSAVYALVNALLAISSAIIAAAFHAALLLLCCGLFGVLAVFNAWIIGTGSDE